MKIYHDRCDECYTSLCYTCEERYNNLCKTCFDEHKIGENMLKKINQQTNKKDNLKTQKIKDNTLIALRSEVDDILKSLEKLQAYSSKIVGADSKKDFDKLVKVFLEKLNNNYELGRCLKSYLEEFINNRASLGQDLLNIRNKK